MAQQNSGGPPPPPKRRRRQLETLNDVQRMMGETIRAMRRSKNPMDPKLGTAICNGLAKDAWVMQQIEARIDKDRLTALEIEVTRIRAEHQKMMAKAEARAKGRTT